MLEEDHVNVDEDPEFTVVGEAVSVNVGTPGAETETVTLSVVVPPGPVHEIVYVVAAVIAPDD